MSEFDFEKALAEGRAGMAQTLDANPVFNDAYHRYILNLPHGHEFNTCEIRKYWTGPQPNHVNCWGAATNACARRGLIEKIAFIHPDSVRSHGSVIFEWRRK